MNLQSSLVQSAPLRHIGMVGCRKGHCGFVQLGKNLQSSVAWWVFFCAGEACRAVHLRFWQAGPKGQGSEGSMAVPGGAAGD